MVRPVIDLAKYLVRGPVTRPAPNVATRPATRLAPDVALKGLIAYVLAVLLFLFALLTLAACSDESAKQAGQGEQAEQVKQATLAAEKTADSPLILGVMPSLDYLPLAIAEREGYFSELDLPVTIQLFFSANERDAAFQSGHIDGTVIDYTGAIIQHANGVDLRLTSRCDAPFYLVASPGSKVTTLVGLKKHSVAVSQNTVIDYLVDQALAKAEIPADEITKVEINRIPIRYEMLVNNKIDATGLPNPFALLAEKAKGTILISNQDMNLSITGIMFTGASLQTKGQQVRKLYQAYAKGVDYLNKHSMQDVQNILIDRFGYTEALVAEAAPPRYEAPALPDEESIRQVTTWLKERELISPDYDPFTAGLLDGNFLPAQFLPVRSLSGQSLSGQN